MSSKFKIWDFEKKLKTLYFDSQRVPFFIKTDDSYLADLCFLFLKKQTGELQSVDGAKLTIDFLERNFFTLDLFFHQKNIFVRSAEKMPKDVLKFLEEKKIDLGENHLIFMFNKNEKLFSSLEKKKIGASFCSVEGPMFWEESEFFYFLARYNHLHFTPDSTTFLLGASSGSSDFRDIFSVLSVYQGEEISLSMVKELLNVSHLDRFAMARLFSKKDFSSFYQGLIEFSEDYLALQGFFSFMQGHLNKLLDTSYVEKKKKASKYDQEIMVNSRSWNKHGLIRGIEHFSELEILAKRKDRYLKERLRLVLVKGIS